MIFTAREIAQLRHLQILAAKVTKGQLHGEREMSRAGPGSGFREHRAYHQGDALRTVDWNVYARMDALVVKEFDAEEALDLVLVQDKSASMEGAAALCAAKVVGALGAIALSQLDRVLLVPAGGWRGVESFMGRSRLMDLLGGVDSFSRIMDELDKLKEPSIDYYAAVRSITRQRRNAEIRNGKPAEGVPLPNIRYDFNAELPAGK